MRGEIVGARQVERAAMRLRQRRPAAGNDDGFSHGFGASYMMATRVIAMRRPVSAPTEQLDWARLAAYLRAHLPPRTACPVSMCRATMEVEQFPGGHSNLTYLLRFGDVEFVLRRPPFGPVPPTAHDMAREYRWLAAMHPVFPLAPRPYLLCEDIDVIGASST